MALLTGSKNALKGVGFFLGGLLLSVLGFQGAVGIMAAALLLVWIASLFLLRGDLGKAKAKPKFTELLSKSRAVNILSAARLFLFGARDVWFVVALPVFLGAQLGWDYWQVGGFLAAVGDRLRICAVPGTGHVTGKPKRRARPGWPYRPALGDLPLMCGAGRCMALAARRRVFPPPAMVVIVGLAIFGVLFAVNSALHSYLILSYAKEDGVSLDVGFYYMANAMGRSAWYGIVRLDLPELRVWPPASGYRPDFLLLTTLISHALPRHNKASA